MSTTQYAKPFLDESQQVALLSSRGLSVSDPKMAAEFLKRVNYYRLSGYAIPFLVDREHFKPDASFDDLMAVYCFDRVLRDLLFEALEAAELAYRAIFAHQLSQNFGPLGYRDAANFKNASVFKAQLAHFDKTIADSSESCIVHFKSNYGNDQVPIWALVEVETFGPVTRLYDNAGKDLKRFVAAEYGIGSGPLRSYLQHLRVLRNFCAHHARLVGRRFYGYSPFVEWQGLNETVDTRTLVAQFLFVYRILKGTPSVCFDRDEWKTRLCKAFAGSPAPKAFDLAKLMALPTNFEHSPLWV